MSLGQEVYKTEQISNAFHKFLLYYRIFLTHFVTVPCKKLNEKDFPYPKVFNEMS